MWETNMITPLCFSDNRRRRWRWRRRGGRGVEGEGGVEGVSREKKCCVMDLLSTSPGCQEPQR